jgi:hypothetical protein
MPEYVEVSYQDNLVDCPSYPSQEVMSDPDPISCLLQQRGVVTLPDYTIGSRQYYVLADHQIDAAK